MSGTPPARRRATAFVVLAVITGILGLSGIGLYLITLVAPATGQYTHAQAVTGGVFLYLIPGAVCLVLCAIFIAVAVQRSGR